MQNRSIFFTRLLDPTVWQLNCVALSWHGQTILYEAPPIKKSPEKHGKSPEKRVQWWQNLQVSLRHSCRAIESHSSSMMLDVKMAPLCVTKKFWECHSEAYYQHPQLLPSRSFSLSLPLFAFLSVPPCHSVRQRRGPVTQHKHTPP